MARRAVWKGPFIDGYIFKKVEKAGIDLTESLNIGDFPMEKA